MLGFDESVEWLTRVSGLWWYGQVLRRDEEHVLRGLMDRESKVDRGTGGESDWGC